MWTLCPAVVGIPNWVECIWTRVLQVFEQQSVCFLGSGTLTNRLKVFMQRAKVTMALTESHNILAAWNLNWLTPPRKETWYEIPDRVSNQTYWSLKKPFDIGENCVLKLYIWNLRIQSQSCSLHVVQGY